MKRHLYFILFISLLSCNKENEEDLNATPNPTTPPTELPVTTVSYTEEVIPILTRACVFCHNTQNASGAVNLSSYQTVSQVVTPLNSGSSLLYGSVAQTFGYPMPPPPNPKLTDEQINTIKTWIDEGAINN